MKSFRSLIVPVTAAIVVLVGRAHAQMPPGTVIEAAIETAADQVIFPSTLAGTVQVRNCTGCLHPILQLDANTRFNLAGKNVALREMAAYASSARGQPLTIHYRLRDNVVSLVSVLTK